MTTNTPANEIGDDQISGAARFHKAFKPFPYAVVITFIVVFPLLLCYHAWTRVVFPPEIAFMVSAWADELKNNETGGDLVRNTDVGAKQKWLASYRESLSEVCEMINKGGLAVLDRSDYVNLKVAPTDRCSVSEEVKSIERLLRSVSQSPQSEEEAKTAIKTAATRMSDLRNRLPALPSTAASGPRQRKSASACDIRRMAEEQILRLEEKLQELKNAAGWTSRENKPISSGLSTSSQCDEMISLCEETSQRSRIAYVLLRASVPNENCNQDLDKRFVRAEEDAEGIMTALAEHPSLNGPAYSEARKALIVNAARMKSRIQTVASLMIVLGHK